MVIGQVFEKDNKVNNGTVVSKIVSTDKLLIGHMFFFASLIQL